MSLIEHINKITYNYFMADFIRARSLDHKEERLKEIKQATEYLFKNNPYHQITLTTIAEQLEWSRANLYKYVSTKEDIFLDISKDKMSNFLNSLLAAFPENNNFSFNVIAEVWSGILNANQDYLIYVSILNTIIETNVTVDRLASFKKAYYDLSFQFAERLSKMINIDSKTAYNVFFDILIFASSICTCCVNNPLIIEATKKINVEVPKIDFVTYIKDFILMKFNWVTKQ